MTFYEVIFDHPSKANPPYGIAFHNKATADRFAARLKASGYHVDEYPACETTGTVNEALDAARLFFGDPTLTPEPIQ